MTIEMIKSISNLKFSICCPRGFRRDRGCAVAHTFLFLCAREYIQSDTDVHFRSASLAPAA